MPYAGTKHPSCLDVGEGNLAEMRPCNGEAKQFFYWFQEDEVVEQEMQEFPDMEDILNGFAADYKSIGDMKDFTNDIVDFAKKLLRILALMAKEIELSPTRIGVHGEPGQCLDVKNNGQLFISGCDEVDLVRWELDRTNGRLSATSSGGESLGCLHYRPRKHHFWLGSCEAVIAHPSANLSNDDEQELTPDDPLFKQLMKAKRSQFKAYYVM